MVALWKTVRFHGALPVLSTPQSIELLDWANAPVICKKPAMYEPEVASEAAFALALPTLGVLTTDASHLIHSRQCMLVFTDGEIPYQLEIQKLEQLVTAMRSLLAS